MKTQLLIYSVLLSVVAGGSGYGLRAMRERSASTLSNRQTPSLEYFLPALSFSEVENAKAVLEALSDRFISEIRSKRAQDMVEAVASGGKKSPADEERLLEVLKILDEGLEEFKGTEQEMPVVRHLLLALKKARLLDRWIDVYLDTLYRRPTADLVGRFAAEALTVGRTAGREVEVIEGFRHVIRIPLAFETKPQVEAALSRAEPENHLAQSWH